MIRKLIGSFILLGCIAQSNQVLAQDKTVDQIVSIVGSRRCLAPV